MRAALPFAGFYAAFFLTLGIYLPFWPVFLAHRGLSGGEIGTVLALGTWAKVAVSPVMGRIADRSGRPRGVMAALAAFAVLAAAALIPARGFWPVLGVHILLFAAFQAILPLGESRTMAAVRAGGLDYGRLRLWGSVAFIAAVLAIGALLDARPPDAVLGAIMASMALLAATTLLLPAEAASGARRARAPMSALLRRRGFVLFLTAGALLQASHAVYYAFSAVHWKAAGIAPATVARLWAEGVVAEILLFAVGGGVLARLGPLGLLLAAAAAGLLRWGVLATTTEVAALAAAQALHGLTFGAAHLGAVHYIARTAPPGLASTAQSVYAALSGGVGMGLAMLAGGALYDSIAGGAFYAMAAMSAVAGLLVLRLRRAGRAAAGHAVP